MPTLNEVSTQDQRAMLADMCARNHPCQLYYTSAQGKKFEAKVRLLQLNGNRVLIDLPVANGRPFMIQPGERIEMYFLWKGQRYALRAAAVERTRWKQNKTIGVEALAITYPQALERAQRRECFRLSLMHLPSATIALLPWKEGEEDATESPANGDPQSPKDSQLPVSEPPLPRYQGRMMNLSETGCGAVFNKDDAPALEVGQVYRAVFVLPGIEESFDFIGQIRWMRDHPGGDRIMTGMAWQLDPTNRAHRNVQDRLGKFIVIEQQAALRRMRNE